MKEALAHAEVTLESRLESKLAESIRGRRFLVAMGPHAAALPWTKELLALGADGVLVLGCGLERPRSLPHRVEWLPLSGEGWPSDQFEALQQYEALLADLPRTALAEVDRFDKRGEALAIVSELVDLQVLAGRRRFGARKSEWRQWERKTQAKPLWNELPFFELPSMTGDIEDMTAIGRMVAHMDEGYGAVVSSDPPTGFGFGCRLVRHVSSGKDLPETIRFFRQDGCSTLRIMPFFVGVPCSIHGLVTPQGVAVFRPVEQLIFREAGTSRFVYAGVATYWDPSEADRELMREVALMTGETLMRVSGYRGAFGVDGVLGRSGFRPTEINARMCAGLALVGAGCSGISLPLLDLIARDGATWNFQPQLLERVINKAADKNRGGAAFLELETQAGEPRRIPLVRNKSGWDHAVSQAQLPDAWIRTESHSGTTGLWFLTKPERTQAGPELALQIPPALEIARNLGVDVPRLIAASQVHCSSPHHRTLHQDERLS